MNNYYSFIGLRLAMFFFPLFRCIGYYYKTCMTTAAPEEGARRSKRKRKSAVFQKEKRRHPSRCLVCDSFPFYDPDSSQKRDVPFSDRPGVSLYCRFHRNQILQPIAEEVDGRSL
jgi:hypothetical protein